MFVTNRSWSAGLSVLKYVTICVVALVPAFASLEVEAQASPARNGAIHGQVTDAESGRPLIGATVAMVGRFGGAIADTSGQFRLTGLPSGEYALRISHVGYDDLRLDSIFLADGQERRVDAVLHERITTVRGITVTPGRFEIMGTQPAAQQSLTRSELETVPQLGDDFFRAVTRLPGMSGNDFSTRFVVRGGEYDEVLVTLDGLQIYEPFHLKDIDGGAMSVVDVAAVEGIDLQTGGFTADYGDKMSGVFNIRSKQVPPDNSRFTVGLSMLNARLLSEGGYAKGKGSWLVSARRGYIDLVLDMVDPENRLSPTYYDVFAKTRYQLSNNQILGISLLHAGDNLHFYGEDDDYGDSVKSSYGNSYGWLTLWSELHPRITARTLASVGQVTHERSGQDYNNGLSGVEALARDEEDFRFVGLKSDFEYDVNDGLFLRWGYDLKWLKADYDYFSQDYEYGFHTTSDSFYVALDGIDSTRVAMHPSGRTLGLYLTGRQRLLRLVAAELGVRYDGATHSGDRLASPRAGLVFELGPRTTLRTGWGIYRQSEGIDEMFAQDGENAYFPAERAEQWGAGLQHDFENGAHLRVETYLKKYSDLRPDYRNTFDEIEMFPELEEDRTAVHRSGARSRGIELYLKKDTHGKVSWWASYALSKVDDDVTRIDFIPEGVAIDCDKTFPSPNDQRHTIYFDLNYRPSHNWQINLAMQYHTGWPYTGVHLATVPVDGGGTLIYVQADEQWSSRLDSYRRLDVRINRYFRVGRGRITAFIELINALDFDNVRGYSYEIVAAPRGGYALEAEPENWFGRLPAFGVAYEVGL